MVLSPWERVSFILFSECFPLCGWFASRAKSPRLREDSAGSSKWTDRLDFKDALFIASLVMLFCFGIQNFPFGTRDELSLCALVAGIAIILRVMENDPD